MLQSGVKSSSVRSPACNSPGATPGRKPSDSDVNSYIKKASLEKKELSSEERKVCQDPHFTEPMLVMMWVCVFVFVFCFHYG